jgi:hypothetical protein
MSVSDVTPCPKTGLFKPSINPAADHETGLVTEPAEREPAEREPAEREPEERRTADHDTGRS